MHSPLFFNSYSIRDFVPFDPSIKVAYIKFPTGSVLIRCAGWEIAGDWDDDQYDRTTPADIHPVVKYGEDWDDDHYDPTTPGEVDLEYIAECEPSEGGLREDWDEDDWIAWRRQQLG